MIKTKIAHRFPKKRVCSTQHGCVRERTKTKIAHRLPKNDVQHTQHNTSDFEIPSTDKTQRRWHNEFVKTLRKIYFIIYKRTTGVLCIRIHQPCHSSAAHRSGRRQARTGKIRQLLPLKTTAQDSQHPTSQTSIQSQPPATVKHPLRPSTPESTTKNNSSRSSSSVVSPFQIAPDVSHCCCTYHRQRNCFYPLMTSPASPILPSSGARSSPPPAGPRGLLLLGRRESLDSAHSGFPQAKQGND